MGSLLDGIETTPAPTKTAKSGGAAGTETSKTLKLVIAIGCFLVGGGLIAWNLGLFQFGEPAPNSQAAASTVTPSSNVPANRPTQSTQAAPSSQVGQPTAPVIKSGPQAFTK